TFSTLREKIVLDLTVKVLQVQQVRLGAGSAVITPVLPGLTPPVSPADPPVRPEPPSNPC
ncbi:Uracil permease, partial [Lysinibacillus sp. M3]